MAPSASAAPVIEGAPTSFPLPLEEFCARLSSEDKRVEMIGGFYHVERKAGHLRDSDASYRARFQSFVNAPA